MMSYPNKILMIIPNFFPQKGGAEVMCDTLSGYLTKKGFHVSILTQYLEGYPEQEIIDGVTIYRKIRYFGVYWLSYMLTLLLFLWRNRKKYDVMILFGLYLTVPPAVFMKKIGSKKLVVRLECSGLTGDLNRIKKIKGGFWVRKLWRKADAIIAISEDIFNELNKKTVKNVIKIPNFVNTDKFFPKTVIKRTSNKVRILFTGRLVFQKAVDVFLDALSYLDEEIDFIVYIVGDGDLKRELQRKAANLGLVDKVSFEGRKEEVLQYYQNSDIFVLPSRAEGMPIALLEAMACGLPAVVTNVSGMAEIVENGINGFVVPVGDARALAKAIRVLGTNKKMGIKMGRLAREKVLARYSLDIVGEKYIQLIKKLHVSDGINDT